MSTQPLKFSYTNYKGEISIRNVIPNKIEFGVNMNLIDPKWLLYAYDLDKKAERTYVIEHMMPVEIKAEAPPETTANANLERHFCVTVYVKNPDDGKFLLIKHKKLGKWLPPGGHIEKNETPDVAAIRECLEETGLNIQLIGERGPVVTSLIRPYGIQNNVIKKDRHEHMDLIYFAMPMNKTELKQNTDETDGVCWASADEILNGSYETFQEVKQWITFFQKAME